MSGKGDTPRPFDGKRFRDGYERVFGKPESDISVSEGIERDFSQHEADKLYAEMWGLAQPEKSEAGIR